MEVRDRFYGVYVVRVREAARIDIRAAAWALFAAVGIGWLTFAWASSALETSSPYEAEWPSVLIPTIVLIWPMWAATHVLLTRLGIVRGYRTVGREKLWGLHQKRSGVETPVLPSFVAAVVVMLIIPFAAAA